MIKLNEILQVKTTYGIYNLDKMRAYTVLLLSQIDSIAKMIRGYKKFEVELMQENINNILEFFDFGELEGTPDKNFGHIKQVGDIKDAKAIEKFADLVTPYSYSECGHYAEYSIKAHEYTLKEIKKGFFEFIKHLKDAKNFNSKTSFHTIAYVSAFETVCQQDIGCDVLGSGTSLTV